MTPRKAELRRYLDAVYTRYNHPACRTSDPLQYVYRFEAAPDREVTGLLAASLAYGNVKAIHASIEAVLARLGSSPANTVASLTRDELRLQLDGFVHRWTRADALTDLLHGAGRVQHRWGSLGEAFASDLDRAGGELQPALVAWTGRFRRASGSEGKPLMADPGNNSACKRLHLYLRWMVRSDRIDPGVWSGVSPALLQVPVDVHMHRIGRWLGFTRRKAADRRTVEEITRGFRRLRPDDPCRYDFALTRLGMEGAVTRRDLLTRLAVSGRGLEDGTGSLDARIPGDVGCTTDPT